MVSELSPQLWGSHWGQTDLKEGQQCWTVKGESKPDTFKLTTAVVLDGSQEQEGLLSSLSVKVPQHTHCWPLHPSSQILHSENSSEIGRELEFYLTDHGSDGPSEMKTFV